MRPTRENITLLKRELRAPRFQSYSLCARARPPPPPRNLPSRAHAPARTIPASPRAPPPAHAPPPPRPPDFSHLVPQMYLQDLAEADAPKELVAGVQARAARLGKRCTQTLSAPA